MRQVWLGIPPASEPCELCDGPIHYELCVPHGDVLLSQCNCGKVEFEPCIGCALEGARARKRDR